jgi:hypothetical protein
MPVRGRPVPFVTWADSQRTVTRERLRTAVNETGTETTLVAD